MLLKLQCMMKSQFDDEGLFEKNGGQITVKDIQKLLVDKFDCNYSSSGIYALLDRINLGGIDDMETQQEFLK